MGFTDTSHDFYFYFGCQNTDPLHPWSIKFICLGLPDKTTGKGWSWTLHYIYCNSVVLGAIDEHNSLPYYGEPCSAIFAVTYSSGAGSDRSIVSGEIWLARLMIIRFLLPDNLWHNWLPQQQWWLHQLLFWHLCSCSISSRSVSTCVTSEVGTDCCYLYIIHTVYEDTLTYSCRKVNSLY